MVSRLTCLQSEDMLDLLEARLPESEEAILVLHLDHCADCRERLDELVSASERAAGDTSDCGEFGPAYHRAVESLKDGDLEGDEDDAEFLARILDFLQQSQNPHLLGRFGRYEVLEFLGRGGMGIVVRARDPLLDRTVAIKVLNPRIPPHSTVHRRFEREARAAAAVSHENVVAIHGASERDGLLYLVMQYVPGGSLAERIQRESALELTEILRIATQTAQGLAAAHAQGIVHRDIKPGNILLEDGFERVRITDFGLAHIMDDASLTGSGLIAGTPAYMSPEHTEEGPIDDRADLFSLGSVIYSMCTGEQPFRGSTSMAVMRSVREDRPTPIRELNPEIPKWLADVTKRLLAKNPKQRYQTASEVAEVLRVQLANLQRADSDAYSEALSFAEWPSDDTDETATKTDSPGWLDRTLENVKRISRQVCWQCEKLWARAQFGKRWRRFCEFVRGDR